MADPFPTTALFGKGVNAMEPANILIVEDEPVVAKDIQLSLQRLGYRVPATATSGEEAIRKAGDTHPDLILMDIVLKGNMDGVETALQIQRRHDVPVIYLTAYADNHTLERAKVTSPAGYMLKPYQANELRTMIELALHRAQHDRHLRERLRWIATTVRCIGDAIVTTDQGGACHIHEPGRGSLYWMEPRGSCGDERDDADGVFGRPATPAWQQSRYAGDDGGASRDDRRGDLAIQARHSTVDSRHGGSGRR